MKYSSGRAFRQALEVRLKEINLQQNLPLVRLRKQVVFERLIARLITVQPDAWVLKGGLAIQLRLGSQSRTTKDIDLLNLKPSLGVYDSLSKAAALEMEDWFEFEVTRPDTVSQEDFGGTRYLLNCLLAGRLFESFHVDVGSGDVLIEKYDLLVFESLLTFADIAPVTVPCYPVAQQISEKLHALTRQYASGGSTRAKDIVDILLLAKIKNIDGSILNAAVKSTFTLRDTHPLPKELPEIPNSLRREYNRLVDELDLEYANLEDAVTALMIFINPILALENIGKWMVEKWEWV